MNRRRFLLDSGCMTAGSALFLGRMADAAPRRVAPVSKASRRPPALPSPEQIAWQDLELGMFVHFAPNTWQDKESDDLSTPLAAINPQRLDTDQWARTAVALGARYIVFVAKHQGGFCMWQTQTTDYSIRNTPWRGGRGDVLADVAQSCRKHGLKLGVYVCPRDDHFGAATGGVCKTAGHQASYDRMYRQQLTEVFSRYGPLVEIWFDGSTRTHVADLIARYQPHAAIFQGPQATIRWVGNEDGFAPYPCWNSIDKVDAESGTATALNSDPDGDVWMPSEVDVSIRRPDWFWSTGNASKVLTTDQLIEIYYRSVGRGAQLLLNIPANRDGLLSDKDCRIAGEFGDEIRRRFGTPVAATRGRGRTILLPFARPASIDTVVIEEETAAGERISGFRIEGRTGNQWRLLGEGTSVGHKRIQPVDPVLLDAVRLVSVSARDTPVLRSFAAFATGSKPPDDWNAPAKMWAADLVGEWEGGVFRLDLAGKVKAAAQYRVRFIPLSGRVTGFRELLLRLRGTPQPALVRKSAGRADELILDMTEAEGEARLTGRVTGAPRGQILMQQL